MGVILPVGGRGILLPGGPQAINPRDFAVPEGLVGYWSPSPETVDTTNNRLLDISGCGNHGTLNGSTKPSLVQGNFGHGLLFTSAASAYVDCGSMSSAFDGATKITIAGWFRRTATGNTIWVSKDTDGTHGIIVGFYSTLGAVFRICDGTLSYGSWALNDTAVHHLVLVFDGSQATDATRLLGYVDGVPRTLTFNGNPVPAALGTYSNTFRIGYANTIYSNGSCFGVRVYNRVLSPWEITELYKSGLFGRRDAGASLRQEFDLGVLPRLGFVGHLRLGTGIITGHATVAVKATGSLRPSSPSFSGSVVAPRFAVGHLVSAPLSISGEVRAPASASGYLVCRPPSITGIAKPPAFQRACEAKDVSDVQVHIVELEVLQRNLTGSVVQWVIPFGVVPFGSIPDEDITLPTSPIIVFRFSDTGYATPPTGTYPNTLFEPRVEQPLRMSRTLPVVPEQSRRVAVEFGGITLINVDGFFDAAAAIHASDGRPVRVLFGLNSYPYDDFTPVFTGRSVSWTPDFPLLKIDVRDQTYLLDVPLQTESYSGEGGIDGTDSIAGKPRPWCCGEAGNVTPLLIDPPNRVYQFHWREVQGVDAVYDRGAPLEFDADYADYAALIAASIPDYEYATCLALGLIRVNSTPVLLTADVRGDANGGYIDTISTIAQRFILSSGAYTSSDLDPVAWAALEAEFTGKIGWYCTTPITISEAVSEIVGSAAAWWGADFSGLLTAGVLTAPDSTKIVRTFTEADVRDVAKINPPSGSFPPRWRQRVGHARNFTPMSGSDVAPSVSATRIAFLNEEYRLVSASNDQTRVEFLTSTNPDPLKSLFVEASDAQAVAANLLELLSVPRQTLKFTTGLVGYIPKLGSTIRLIHPRAGDGTGWIARVIDIDIDATEREITLTIWG